MPSESSESTTILLQVLASLRGDIGDIREDIADVRAITAEVKGELMHHEMTLKQVLRRAQLTNGTLIEHGGRLSTLEARHIRDDGFADGRKAERDRLYVVAKIAAKPVTWAVGGLIGAVGYIVKGRAG